MAENRTSSFGSLYDNTSLLQYCNDDNLSASSSMEVDDRLSYLEQRVQLQEDEIQLLKAALADVLRRLSSFEEQSQGFGKRGGPTKDDGYVKMFLRGRPITMHLPDGLKGSYSLETKAQLPEQKLKLQWVYPFHRNSTANRKAQPVKCFDLRKL
ncbi:UNVERIFIED_CONTAM: hypothetical protein FKN15_078529 [Acipenser sinensis]